MLQDNQKSFVANLFRKYGRDVRGFLGQRVRIHEDIEDLTQETFLKAQRTVDWSTIENPKAYLIQIARNLFLDRLRGEKRSPVDFDQGALPADIESSDHSPEQQAIHQDEYGHLCNAIEKLTPKVRKAIVLHKFFNLSHTEVARAMGISPRTVEKHIAKGVAECLRHMMIVEQRAMGNNIVPIAARATAHRGNDAE